MLLVHQNSLVHQLESTLAKASWINSLFIAFIKDHSLWEQKTTVKQYIDNVTVNAITEIILAKWRRDGRLKGLRNDMFIIGTFFDPHYTLSREQLNQYVIYDIDYLGAIDKVIKG